MEKEMFEEIGTIEGKEDKMNKNGQLFCKLKINNKNFNLSDPSKLNGINLGDNVVVKYTVSTYEFNGQPVQSKQVVHIMKSDGTSPAPMQQQTQTITQPVRPQTSQPNWDEINKRKETQEEARQIMMERLAKLRAKSVALEVAKDVLKSKGTEITREELLEFANFLYLDLTNEAIFNINNYSWKKFEEMEKEKNKNNPKVETNDPFLKQPSIDDDVEMIDMSE